MTERPRVLVVEDDGTIGEVLVDVLHDEGYEVRLGSNGREALRVLRDWLPDVIVLDLMMPVMDGGTFRAAQRRLPGPAAGVPIIILTGAHEGRAQAANLAATAVLTKPFELDDLVRVVGRLCQRPP